MMLTFISRYIRQQAIYTYRKVRHNPLYQATIAVWSSKA
jgi:hypothetical protein